MARPIKYKKHLIQAHIKTYGAHSNRPIYIDILIR